MKRHRVLALLSLALIFCFTIIPTVHAASVPIGITQGEFALWLVKEAGAIRQLPAAASAQDAFDFLRKLGVVPAEGWDPDKEVDEAFLKSFLDENSQTGSFDDLVTKVQDQLDSHFNNANPSVFKAGAVSGSAPA